MIHLSDITKEFGSNKALSGINLEIEAGEFISLIGPSGSGKTTLLRHLNAQHLPTSGTLTIHGEHVPTLSPKALKALRCKIAYIPQDLGLVSSLKVYQNILLGKVGHFHSLTMLKKFLAPSKSDLETIHQVLNTVGIPEKLYDTTSTLSGGQQQRVAVARALFQNPHTILADEPVSAVDPARAKSMVELLKEIATKNNITVLMSIHNIGLAVEYFPRVIGLRKGKLVLDSTSPNEQELASLFELDSQDLIG